MTASYTNASFNDKNVGTGKVVSCHRRHDLGRRRGQLLLNTAATTTANITPKALDR